MDHLFPGEIADIPGFIKYSSRLRNALGPHVCALLSKGISIVLDFPGNTKAQRAWFRELFERANTEHELHFVDASDACRFAEQKLSASTDYSPVIKAIKQVLPAAMALKDITAASVALIDGGTIVWSEGFGYTDRRKK